MHETFEFGFESCEPRLRFVPIFRPVNGVFFAVTSDDFRVFYAGVDPKTVQTVLRHANVAVTMENYVIPDAAEVKAAMKDFGKTIQTLGITRKKGP